MGFFDDPEDWMYVVDSDSFGVLNAMITHDKTITKKIVIELINNKLYSVISYKIPNLWSCASIEYSHPVAFTNITQFSLPRTYYTTQSLFEMLKKESEL